MLSFLIEKIYKIIEIKPYLDERKNFRYYPIILTLFCAFLITSHVAAVKLVSLYGVTLTGAFFIFPFTYTLNCIAVEVYGYKNARMLIWCGFLLSFIYIFLISITAAMPPSPYWMLDNEFKSILAPQGRIIFCSLLSYIISDFIHVYIMAKHKIKYNGKCLFRRVMIASTLSILIGVIVFLGFSYYGTIPNQALLYLMIAAFFKKIFSQLILFPVTCYFIYLLKNLEGVDIYDYKTNFIPFNLDNVYNLDDFRIKNQ
jgi:queuosine precursor transporter